LETIGRDTLGSFYLEAHDMIRNITGYGAGNGPFISIHDGFQEIGSWADFLVGSDRIVMDTHPYFAFDGSPNDDPIGVDGTGGTWPKQACQAWGASFNTSQVDFGVTVAGEFSNGYNDCGLFLTGVNGTQSYGGDCSLWQDATNWNQTTKDGVKHFAMASMDALQDWFFWTWKIANSSSGVIESPLWSYSLGLQNGFIPTDPRTAVGTCGSLDVTGPQFNGTYQSWMTGGASAGSIVATATAALGIWPPVSIANVPIAQVSLLPLFTATGAIATLPPPSGTQWFAAKETGTGNAGDGWYDASDTVGGVTAIVGCTYPNAWDAVTAAVPLTMCPPGATGAGAVLPTTTSDTALVPTTTTTDTSTTLKGVDTSTHTSTGTITTPATHTTAAIVTPPPRKRQIHRGV